MNNKRAFIAAAAVLMMPGLVMAQSTNTFNVTNVSNVASANLPVTMTCNSGFPLTQEASTPVNFSVSEVSAGATCSAVLSDDLPSGTTLVGYTTEDGTTSLTGCDWDITNAVGEVNHSCVIETDTETQDYNVTVTWSLNPNAPESAYEDAVVNLQCVDAWDGSGLTTVTLVNQPAYPGAPMPVSMEVDPAPAASGVMTMCSALMSGIDTSVDVDESDCGPDGTNDGVLPADGSGLACTITAVAFFEGIPTLSQYGMAIMVLLMLGVGFVGFRRFV